MTIVSAILPAVATASGVEIRDILAALRKAFQPTRIVSKDFRSRDKAPTMAGSVKTGAPVIELAAGLPFIAGSYLDGWVNLTAVQLSETAMWYGDFNEAKLVLKGVELSSAMALAARGRRIADVIDHPALAMLDDTVIGVNMGGGGTTIRTTTSRVRVDDGHGSSMDRSDRRRGGDDATAANDQAGRAAA